MTIHEHVTMADQMSVNSLGMILYQIILKCYKRLSASLQLYNIHNTKYMFTVI